MRSPNDVQVTWFKVTVKRLVSEKCLKRRSGGAVGLRVRPASGGLCVRTPAATNLVKTDGDSSTASWYSGCH